LRELERQIKTGSADSPLLGDLRALGEQQASARELLGDQVEDAKKHFKERVREERASKGWFGW
jgi:hypothetical protein